MDSVTGHDRQVRRLHRKPLSCVSCRTKKLRCDRETPTCGNCRCRPEVGACDYPESNRSRGQKKRAPLDGAPARANVSNINSAAQGSNEDLQAKVDRLEQAIQYLTSTNDPRLGSVHGILSRPSDTPVDHDDVHSPRNTPMGTMTASMGAVNASPATSSGAAEALWVSLLSEIKMPDNKTDSHEPANTLSRTPTLLFAASRAVPVADILLHLPSRFICDKIITTYFSSREPTSCILHRPTFLEAYEKFWQQPESTSITWLAVLLGILRIVVSAWGRDGTEPEEVKGKCLDLETSYRQRASECLSHLDYAHPQPFLLEALLLQLYVLYSASRDFHSSVWVQHSIAVRLSIRLGYHIDPANLRDIGPFQAEMRKRIWTFVRQADVLFSFQIGLPSMLDHRWLDDSMPANLDDADISDGMTAPPVPRPDTDVTSVSYIILKSKLVFGFARALNALSRNDSIPYSRVLEFDNEIRGIYRNIPSQYQVIDLGNDDTQDALLTGLQLVLGAIYHKALCTIHSRFLKSAITDQQFLYSWLVCINSAMTLLTYQSFIHQSPRADHQNTRLLRYQHSLTTHDFFLAATMLCTALFLLKNSTVLPICASMGPSKHDMMTALENGVSIFACSRIASVEARRASERLAALLKELQGGSPNDLNPDQLRLDIVNNGSHAGFDSVPAMALSKSTPSTAYGQTSVQPSRDSGALYDLTTEIADWDMTNLGLDLDDPLAFVQDFQSQDSYFI